MYVVMNFGVFVCSACAGIHREFSHKVKGISMCVFSDAELKDLTDNGNAVSEHSPLWRPLVETLAFCVRVCAEPAGETNEELEGQEQSPARKIGQ